MIVFVSALALRLVFIAEFRESPLYATPIMDKEYHYNWASANTRRNRWYHAREFPMFRKTIKYQLESSHVIGQS